MALVDHVKNSGNVIEGASGIHVVGGDLIYSWVDGLSPTHQIYGKVGIADGEWNRVLGIWYDGKRIPDGDWHLHPGKLSTGDSDPDQGVCSFFPTGLTHSGTVCICFRRAVGEGDPDTAANPPNKLQVIMEAEKYPNFDSAGNLIDFGYTVNPARCMLGNMMRLGRVLKGSTADTERYVSEYWKGRIDFPAWCDWRDQLGTTESVDYRTLPIDGFGLRAFYYNDDHHGTVTTTRIEPSINIDLGTGSPAYGVSTDNFSAYFEGFIKFKYSELYTIYLTHDDFGACTINGNPSFGSGSGLATESDTYTVVANTFYPISLLWIEGSGNAVLKLEWESASQPREPVPTEYLYPSVKDSPIYESHLRFTQATTMTTMMRDYLRVSNSGRQEVNGKLRFFCHDFTTSIITLNKSHIISLKVRERDIRDSQLQNVFDADFLNIESQYLTSARVTYQLLNLQARAGRPIVGPPKSYPNMTVWQAYKLLKREADEATNLNRYDLETNALAYKVLNGDKALVTWEPLNFVNKPMRVVTATDKSPEETADDRAFLFREEA